MDVEQLGWTFQGSAYCQLIPKQTKRLEWVLKRRTDDFNNVIFSDEASIQMESHRL